MKDMTIIGIAGEGFCTDHQAVLVRDRDAGLDTEFSRFDRLRLHGSVNCCLQQLLNTGFTNSSAKATYLSSVTR